MMGGEDDDADGENRGKCETESQQSDTEALETTREMGRAVIDQQVENLNNLDDKAAQTIRFNVLILGIILTVFSLAFKNDGATEQVRHLMSGAVVAGVVLSGISILTALWAYTSSRKEVGPTGAAMEEIIADGAGYSRHQWLRIVIRSQSRWIAKNEQVNRYDAFALFVSHLYHPF